MVTPYKLTPGTLINYTSLPVRRTALGIIFLFGTLLAFGQVKINDTGKLSSSDSSLNSAKSDLNERFNIGYGTLKKREITGSVTHISSDDFNVGNITDPAQLIQGKVSGLSVSKAGSDPGQNYYLRLRGLNTVNAVTQPLFVVDGLIDGDIENVDPFDIESITVLKDCSSSAIYGGRGSNGVVIVNTKKGKQGSALIEYNVYSGAETVAKNTPMMNAAEWRALSNETGRGTDFGYNTDWFKQIEQTAYSQAHNISLSGGTDKTSFRASVNYRQAKGIQVHTGYTQLNSRLNISQKALNDKLNLDLNLGVTERESQFGFSQAFRYAAISNPTSPVRSTDPEYAMYDGYFQQTLFDYYNPVAICELDKNEGKSNTYSISLKGRFELLNGLYIDAFYAIQNRGILEGIYFDKNDLWGGLSRNGLASRNSDDASNKLFESSIHYNNHSNSYVNFSITGGYSYQNFVNQGFYAQGGNFLTDDFTFNNLSAALDFKNGVGTLTSYKNSNSQTAFFSRIDLTLNNFIFVNLSARYDGSTKFGKNHKWGFYPAVGAGVDLAKLAGRGFTDNLKLRMSYGITGNQPAQSYLSLLQLSPGNVIYYNGIYGPAYYVSSGANPDLRREQSREFEIGLDFTLVKSRISGSLDFYKRSTTDLLIQNYAPTPPNLGTLQWINLGEITSSGMELSIDYSVISKSDFSYSISLEPSTIFENTIVSLSGTYNGGNYNWGTQYLGDLGSPGACCSSLVKVEEGKPVGQLNTYVFNGIDPNGNRILSDLDRDGYIDFRDQKVVGNGLPKFLFGFGNVITYKNWDLNIFFRGVFGYSLLNSYRAHYEVPSYIYSYNLPETASSLRNAETGVLMINFGGLSSKDVENASFVSLDNMSLGYNFDLPGGSAFSKIRLYVAGNRLFYISGYKGSDPEPRYEDSNNYWTGINSNLVPGIDRRDTWPRTRSVTVGAGFVF